MGKPTHSVWVQAVLGIAIAGILALSSCSFFDSAPTSSPSSQLTKQAVEQANLLMERAQYDSAQVLLESALQTSTIEEDSLSWYYLHSFLSEIMYYHALFTEGRALNKQALAVAQAMGDSVLVGNCCNFSGLFLLNQKQPEEALKYFRRAVKLIPSNHQNNRLTYRYQILSNMAETFLALNLPDSAMYYASLSAPEAAARNSERGSAINDWIAGECKLVKKEYQEADQWYRSALEKLEGSRHSDIRQLVMASLIRSAMHAGNQAQAQTRIQEGFALLEDKKTTEFSQLGFLESAVQAAKYFSLPEAAQLESAYFIGHRDRESKSVMQRTKALSRYYSSQKKWLEAEANKRQARISMAQNRRMNLMLWVFLIMLLITLVIGVFYIRQRYKLALVLHQEELYRMETQKELELLKEKNRVIEEERNRIARELHDQVGSSLSSILIYSGLATDKFRDNPVKQMEMLTIIKSQAQEISDQLSDLIWAIQSRNDNMEKLVERMKAHSFQLFSALGIDISFHLDYQVADYKADWEWRKNLLMLFKEAVNNIAKHSGASMVKVNILKNGEELLMEIEDNGCGFDVESRRLGNGLKTMQGRGLTMKGRTELISEKGKGTTIRCYLPIA